MRILKKLLYFLTPSEQKHAIILLIMTIIMGFIDMMGVASILPFIGVITNPNLIYTNFFLNNLFQISAFFGFDTKEQFILFLGVLLFLFLIFSLSFKALTIYFQMKFVQMRGHTLSKRILECYLYKPYNWFLNKNSAELGKVILSEVTIIIGQGLTPIFNFITHSIIAIFLILLLLFVDVKLTLIITFVLGSLYILIFKLFKKVIDRIGKERLIANGLRFKFVSEAFGALKQVKSSGLEKIFINRFSQPSIVVANSQAKSLILSTLPRFFIEGISFGGMLLIILLIISKTGNLTGAISIVSIYAFAGYRLIPSLQQIYQSITLMKFSRSTIDKLYDDLKIETKNLIQDGSTFSFNKVISLNKVNYHYPNSLKSGLKNISLSIKAKTKVGFIGPTGSGKTTIIDIILGLLEPQKGTLEIDGEVINHNNRRSWQRLIGYVPQNIFLSDDTIAANIAFGVDVKKINKYMVEKVSKIANLHDFIKDDLPNQYQTVIGEHGIRLSGGQRQRIGIARALYHNPKVLVLDEATNALDSHTEQVVMDAINNLSKDLTIILIAHRLNTLKNCDIVFKIEKNKTVEQVEIDKINVSNN